MKFCFVCGKKTEKLIEGYCEDCYNSKFSLIKIPKDLRIMQCTKCHRTNQKNTWTDAGIEDFLKDKIKVSDKNVKISIVGKKVLVHGFLESSNKPKEETHEVDLKIVKTVCLDCSRRLGGYHEAIIQLRGKTTKEILNFLHERITEQSFYRIEPVREGFDLYVGDKKVANHVVYELVKKYNFKIRKSYKLATKKEGRDIYKNIISIFCD
jgi:nonsense-mediated mRNA decay protein 3